MKYSPCTIQKLTKINILTDPEFGGKKKKINLGVGFGFFSANPHFTYVGTFLPRDALSFILSNKSKLLFAQWKHLNIVPVPKTLSNKICF